jgi:hypothetical protein
VVILVAVFLLSPGDPGTSAKPGGAGPAPGPGGDNPAATKENLRRFRAGATKEEFEKVFGAGQVVAQDEAERAGAEIDEAIRQNIQQQSAQHRIGTWYVWRNGPGAVYAGFAPTRAGDRLAFSFYASRQGNFVDYQAGALALGPLDQEVEKQAKEQNVFNDPRWKSGAEARNLLLGGWQDPNFGLHYDFRADGTVECRGVYTSTYRFTDDRHIEIPIPHPIDPNQKTPTVYRVLVDQTALYLGEVDGPNIHLRGPMQRTGAGKGSKQKKGR